MLLEIRNKFWSITGKSFVKDSEGNEPFLVKGAIFSPRKKKTICDKDGNPLYTIKNKLFTWWNKQVMIFNFEGEELGRIKKGDFSVTANYQVIGFDDNYTIKGPIVSLTKTIFKNDKEVATIRRNINLFVDKFTLDTQDEENVALYLAFVIALDNIMDRKKKERDRD